MPSKFVASAAVCLLLLAGRPAAGQTLLTQTTWGGGGSDVAEGLAAAPDGSSYAVGITDSFTIDQFGTPSPRIFVLKFAADGSLSWQRIWNGTTLRGVGRPAVATGPGGTVYVTGVSTDNGNDAVLLKFNAAGTLLWERTWGGSASDAASAVATAPDGSAYIAGTETSFGASSIGLFVVKFDSAGNVVWQNIVDGAEGNAVTVGSDGGVYAAGTRARDQLGNFDTVALKMTAAGNLTWERIYSAGDVVDPRGGMAASPDGSVVLAGAIQTIKANTPDIAALIVKLSADGALVFDRVFDGRVNETADGVTVASDDGTIYITGTTTSFGAGFQDAYVLHLQATGKKVLDAVTWGGPDFETGTGVAVNGGTVMLAGSTTAGPPYSLLAAAARLSAPKSTLAIGSDVLEAVAGTVANPAAGAATPAGSTTFSGNFEAAFVRIAR